MVSNRRAGSKPASLLILACAAAAPVALWRDLIASMLEVFRLEFGYLVIGWGGLVLIGLGLLAFVPVALTTGSDPAGRFYPRRRNNWLGWGMSFYLMGLALVLQLAAIAAN